MVSPLPSLVNEQGCRRRRPTRQPVQESRGIGQMEVAVRLPPKPARNEPKRRQDLIASAKLTEQSGPSHQCNVRHAFAYLQRGPQLPHRLRLLLVPEHRWATAPLTGWRGLVT